MNKIIALLQQIDRMETYKMETFLGKLFGYTTLDILLIGVFSCIIAWITR